MVLLPSTVPACNSVPCVLLALVSTLSSQFLCVFCSPPAVGTGAECRHHRRESRSWETGRRTGRKAGLGSISRECIRTRNSFVAFEIEMSVWCLARRNWSFVYRPLPLNHSFSTCFKSRKKKAIIQETISAFATLLLLIFFLQQVHLLCFSLTGC